MRPKVDKVYTFQIYLFSPLRMEIYLPHLSIGRSSLLQILYLIKLGSIDTNLANIEEYSLGHLNC